MEPDSAPQEKQEEQVNFNVAISDDHKSVSIKMDANFIMTAADVVSMMERWIADVKKQLESKDKECS